MKKLFQNKDKDLFEFIIFKYIFIRKNFIRQNTAIQVDNNLNNLAKFQIRKKEFIYFYLFSNQEKRRQAQALKKWTIK